MSTKSLLADEIRDEMEEISKIAIGSEEHRTAVNTVTQLIDREIRLTDIEKNEKNNELNNELEKAKIENDSLRLEFEKRDAKKKNAIELCSIIVSAGLTIWGTIKTIHFEEHGSLTTTAGKSFVNKLFKFKK